MTRLYSEMKFKQKQAGGFAPHEFSNPATRSRLVLSWSLHNATDKDSGHLHTSCMLTLRSTQGQG